MTGFRYSGRVDPVGRAARAVDPDRDQRARELEPLVGIDIHVEFDEPLDPDERQREQRIHYVYFPEGHEPPQHARRISLGPLTAGFIYWLAGAWFWRPSWSPQGSRSLLEEGLDQEWSDELAVKSEEEAKIHARRRVAWHLAGGGTRWTAEDQPADERQQVSSRPVK